MTSRVNYARVVLAGNPNAGKTTLFNALTGSSARVANYPGVTVETLEGQLSLARGIKARVIDLPGTYSLAAASLDEQIAVDQILPTSGPSPDAVIVVVDATQLERNLYLALQIIETGVPVIVALTMNDRLDAQQVTLDTADLERQLRVPVVAVAAHRRGTGSLAACIDEVLRARSTSEAAPLVLSNASEGLVGELEHAVRTEWPHLGSSQVRARALFLLLSVDAEDVETSVPSRLRAALHGVWRKAEHAGVDLVTDIVAARYRRIDDIVDQVRTPTRSGRLRHPAAGQLDRLLTHPVAGVALFVVVMWLVFESLFAWSEPLMDGIELGLSALQRVVYAALPSGLFADLLAEGVIAGVGNVVVFVPQIAILFLLITLLEDVGYLARVAFLIDRLMAKVGLHGKAFVPLLSGYACAVPAVMATRTIESRRDRFVVMLSLPLMSCSARLPVYGLMIATVFATNHRLGGVISTGSALLFAMYGLSLVAALGAASVLRRTVFRGPAPGLVLELPAYRRPVVANVVRATWRRVRSFLVDAGTIILAISILLWGLLNFPRADGAQPHDVFGEPPGRMATAEHSGEQRRVDAAMAQRQLAHSFAGRLGRMMEPALEPLGFDWRISVGIIGSFAAREVLVSTLGMIFGVGADAEDADGLLRERLQQATRSDGSQLFTPLTGLSLMVFFVFAAQCMSTLAVVRRESGSWKWPVMMFTYMTVLAYVASFITYQGGRLLGFA